MQETGIEIGEKKPPSLPFVDACSVQLLYFWLPLPAGRASGRAGSTARVLVSFNTDTANQLLLFRRAAKSFAQVLFVRTFPFSLRKSLFSLHLFWSPLSFSLSLLACWHLSDCLPMSNSWRLFSSHSPVF
jgi:hypothetical protein